MCGLYFAKDGNHLLARGQILSTVSNDKVDTHTQREPRVMQTEDTMASFKACFLKSMREPGQIIHVSGV